jgi:hypothetical protein
MYIGKEEIMEAFYNTAKEFAEKAVECESDLDTDCFSLAYRMEGAVSLVNELLKEEEK